MKKLLMVILAAAMVASFLPKAEAGETAEREIVELQLSVQFREPPVIAIELNETAWKLNMVGLNEKIPNNGFRLIPFGSATEEGAITYPSRSIKPIHAVRNIGNVSVSLDMGYVMVSGCNSGLEPGVDQFSTSVFYNDDYSGISKAIPPKGRVLITKYLRPDAEKRIPLIYYAPTKLTDDIRGMSATYEIRAFGKFFPDPPIYQPVEHEE